jgi:DNA helicase-2/ATP-dependent DNA helicase PcrA
MESTPPYLQNLNDRQVDAVTSMDGYVRVIAGAGSGKTKALTSRYAYLVKEAGVNPANILCVTFTNKAAKEMKDRVKQLIGEEDILPYICTYHSFCAKVLREDNNKIHYPKNFIIMDTEDQKSTLKEIYDELDITSRELTYKHVLQYIGIKKTTTQYLENGLDFSGLDSDELIVKIYYRYLQKQQRNFALDFDDLINFALFIFQNFPDVLEKWQKRLHYILVDETQDSSTKQFSLVKMLSDLHGNLFVVGDPDQTIYEWRGAKPELLVDFDKNFPDVKTIIMNQNYRSTPNILDVGNCLIKNNKNRVAKEMFTENSRGKDVIHYHAKSIDDESKWIVSEIKQLVKQGSKYEDVAILYRIHSLSRSIEQQLVKQQLPYGIYGGIKFFERKEIKDILSYLRLIEFGDDLSFRRVINYPRRGFGKVSLGKMIGYASRKNMSIYNYMLIGYKQNKIKNQKVHDFIGMIEKYRNTKHDMLVSDLLKSVLDETGLTEILRQTGDTDRLDNLMELENSIMAYESSDEDFNLETYLQEISLYTDLDFEDEDVDKVKLMTIHTSKGLEFPYVFLIGFNEGILPSHRSLSEKGIEALEEERRLAYVAITRAEKGLYLTESEGYNPQAGTAQYPSDFLYEIDEGLYKRIGKVPEHSKLLSGAKRALSFGSATRFKVGDMVEHKLFGLGQIDSVDEAQRNYHVSFKGDKTRPVSFRFQGMAKVEEDYSDFEDDIFD